MLDAHNVSALQRPRTPTANAPAPPWLASVLLAAAVILTGSFSKEFANAQQDAAPSRDECREWLRALDSECEDHRRKALRQLADCGPTAAATPRLLRFVNESAGHEQVLAIRCLGHIGPQAAAAIPTLHKLLRNESLPTNNRFAAAHAMRRMGEAGDVAVKTLIGILKDPGPSKKEYRKPRPLGAPSAEGYAALLYRHDERGSYMDRRDQNVMRAIDSLAAYGPRAQAALPRLRKIRSDPKQLRFTRWLATKAMQRIAGEEEEPPKEQ